ncbi:MAG TPA: ATPase, T2SS/T4P/T4SS family, partial [Elusimicrobiales bacterium]|nr:ATPase, T2SS/T4P/T4SS family [Elusimicrobiales bacterium]
AAASGHFTPPPAGMPQLSQPPLQPTSAKTSSAFGTPSVGGGQTLPPTGYAPGLTQANIPAFTQPPGAQSVPKLAPAMSQQPPQQFAVMDPQLEEKFNQLIKGSGRTPAIELAVQISDLILAQAVAQRTSDIHFEYHGANLRIRFRIDGILQDALLVPRNLNIPITQRLRVLAGFDPEPPTTFRNEEGRFQKVMSGKTVQVRVSSFPTINGEKLVLRILDRTHMGLSLDQLGLEANTLSTVKKVIENPYGIFFVTGATGSGKTTTLYAILKTITTPMRNTVTLEDPVEYRLEGINQAQINAKNGFTWNEGLRTVLRQDPDVIMVGEVRDHENAEISMRAALTGHLILTTIHTISAPSVVERLYEMGIPPFLIASSTLGSMAQRLVRRVCPQCAVQAAPPDPNTVNEMVKMLDPEEGEEIKNIINRPGAQFKSAVGCPACRATGYLGRTGIFEIMLMNEELRKQVLSHSTTDQLKRTAIKSGMKTLLMDGIEKSWAGITTLPEILRVTATMV